MTMTELAQSIDAGLAGKTFRGTLKFDCGDEGVIVLAEGRATAEDRATDCTLRLSRDDLGRLLSGKLNPVTGVMTGRIKVSGDMSVALGLGKLLG